MKREWQAQLQEQLVAELGSGYANISVRPSGTGCINDTWEIVARGCDSLFMKTGPAAALAMYEQECAGLDALRQCEAIRVPRVHFRALLGDQAVLVMEFIALTTPRAQHDHAIADALIALHSVQEPRFGFAADNFIGRTPQINQWHDDWWTFWCECRMQPQWRLAQLRGMRPALVEKLAQLIERIPMAFGQHRPRPVLLHGDLWSGNLAVDETGIPCLFDPAVYYGDAEADIAMTKMFGALRPAVYQRYAVQHPDQPDADRRRVLYDLYHWLNHFNLFGVTYLGQVENSVDQLLATMD